MAQQAAMQTLIAWGDEMLLKHPQKILSFAEVIDKADELLQLERKQIIQSFRIGKQNGYESGVTENFENLTAEEYYNQTY